MKEVMKNVSGTFKHCGYKKRGNAFWKIENGFYRLVHFQTGAYGNYYFINVGLHPLGLPMLTMKPQFIIEHPKEYECILRQRAEHIVDGPKLKRFREGFVWTTDEEMVVNICDSVPDIEAWFDKWASYDTIMNSSLEELSGMLTVVPIFWQKAYLMLRCYCAHRMGREEEAKELFREYQHEEVNGSEFPLIDQYLGDLLAAGAK